MANSLRKTLKAKNASALKKTKPASKLTAISKRPKQEERFSEVFQQTMDYVEKWHNLNLTAVPEKPSERMLFAGAKAGQMSIQMTYKVFQDMLKEYEEESMEELERLENPSQKSYLEDSSPRTKDKT